MQCFAMSMICNQPVSHAFAMPTIWSQPVLSFWEKMRRKFYVVIKSISALNHYKSCNENNCSILSKFFLDVFFGFKLTENIKQSIDSKCYTAKPVKFIITHPQAQNCLRTWAKQLTGFISYFCIVMIDEPWN